MIYVFNNCKRRRYRTKETISLVKCVLKKEDKKEYNINVVYVDDRYITQLNKKYLSNNRTTDVISFPLNEDDSLEGDIYINLDQAKRQSNEYSISYSEEVKRLIIHGVLHLIGYSDKTQSNKKIMTNLESKYLELCKKK